MGIEVGERDGERQDREKGDSLDNPRILSIFRASLQILYSLQKSVLKSSPRVTFASFLSSPRVFFPCPCSESKPPTCSYGHKFYGQNLFVC